MLLTPSIYKTEWGYKINCRLANYDQINGMHYERRAGNVTISRNILISTDEKFNPISSQELTFEAAYRVYPNAAATGQEDCRLFHYKDSIWIICYVLDGNLEGSFSYFPQIALGKLPENCADSIPLTLLLGPDPLKIEKNWLPFVYDNAIHVIYSYHPLTIYKIDPITGSCQKVIEVDSIFDASSFRGSAGPIPFDDGYLVLVHEVLITDRRSYFHRLIYLDSNFKITKMSPLFYFISSGIEFANGMTLDHCGNNLIITFGKEDREPYLAIIDIDYIRSYLSIE